MTGGGRGKGNGYFIQPTLFADVDPEARICKEEIFGPVLAFVKAKDFDHALAIANNTEYGLTGSVYSRNRSHLEKARDQFHVGNLYFNRKCTGAPPAASTCPAPIPKPAAPTTCSNSLRPNWYRKCFD